MSPNTRVDYVRMITRKDMQLNDDWLANIGDVFVQEEIGYVADRMPSRELPYQNFYRNSITYELSLNQIKYFRRVYSLLDVLADMGGLYGAISPLCFAIVLLFHYRSSYQFVLADMFVEWG
jgi:hypothetical protein